MNSKVCEENTGIDISKIDVPTIKWSVNKGLNHPGMINTCALDSVLYAFYHILKNTMVKKQVRRNDSSTIGIVMELLSNKQSDMARYKMAEANRNFRDIKVTDDNYGITSSIGDWLSLFTVFLRFSLKCYK